MPAAPVDGPVVAADCGAAWLELGAAVDVLGEGAGVTGVGVAAVELAEDEGTVGAAATGAAVAVDAALVDADVGGADVGVEPIVDVDPVVPLGAFAAARVVAVTISPLVGVSDKNEDALGGWMFATACAASPPRRAVRKASACGGGITIPIDAASCSIR